MKAIRVGAAALNQTALDIESNVRRIRKAIELSKHRGIQILVLPELCITGYGCEDRFLSRDLAALALQKLEEIAPAVESMLVVVGLPIWVESRCIDAAAVLYAGKIAGIVGKQNLANDGIHYEKRWFSEWPRGKRVELEIGAVKVPFGDLLFRLDNLRIAFEICEDAWVEDRPARRFADAHVHLVLNPSASHFQFRKQEIRKNLVRDGSKLISGGYVLANIVGNEAGRAIYDGGSLIAQHGEIRSEARRFSFEEIVLCSADLEFSNDSKLESRADEVELAGTLETPKDFSKTVSPLPDPFSSKEEEFCGAVTLGLFDYMRKSRSAGFVLSLSGGADSAAIAALVHIMAKRALRQLGFDGVKERLSYWSALQSLSDLPSFMRLLLSCVYQKTENSSEITQQAARAVAQSVGAEFLEWDISEPLDWYSRHIEAALGRKLSWEHDNIALQNIQARVRSPGVWFLANVKGALLLVTSNRSEASVGYATMDGDTSGGLAPIAGIDKEYLRQWLVWLEKEGPLDIGKFEPMRLVNVQAPTAELKPPSEKQTDEKDLMPYKVLNEIEKIYLLERRGVENLPRILAERLGSMYSKDQLATWAQKFIKLWHQSQWKRERFAPSFHLDDRNVDPRSWCRFPILSKG